MSRELEEKNKQIESVQRQKSQLEEIKENKSEVMGGLEIGQHQQEIEDLDAKYKLSV